MQEHANGEITVDIRNRVAHLTLNRPQALNALSYEMVLAMATLFTRWASDPTINAIVIRGAQQLLSEEFRARIQVGAETGGKR